MLLKELKRIEQLSIKQGRNDLNPDEERELKLLKEQLYESGGIKSAAAGLVVASNFKWVYAAYQTLKEQSQVEADDGLESEIYWEVIKTIENHVKVNGSSTALGDGEQKYYQAMSHYLRNGRLLDGFHSSPVWKNEPVSGKWMILKGKIKSTVSELLRGHLEHLKPTVGTKVEDRIEPLFNKIMQQLNTDVDAESLTTAEKIKVMDRLSGLLADMKGERKPVEALQVTHNNVFNLIMENKKDSKQLRNVAAELREGDGYELI